MYFWNRIERIFTIFYFDIFNLEIWMSEDIYFFIGLVIGYKF